MNMCIRRGLFLILTAFLAASCSSGGGGGAMIPQSSSKATIKGTVQDAANQPVAGAVVRSQDLSSTTTNADGEFGLQINAGAQKLTITKNGVFVTEYCLAAAEMVTYNLGIITPLSPTNCDLVCTGGASSSDRDCDGLPNSVETAGWDVVIMLADGTKQTKHVVSNPDMKDTDRDGLNDAEEYAARTNPQLMDTDGDGLCDYAELAVYKSNPLMVDTDGDSRGPTGNNPTDPNLWDGYEVLVLHTSPVLADTDGDGKTDYEEVHSGGTSPLVADLPVLALEVYGNPHIALNASIVTGCSKTSTDLVREAQEHVNTDNVTTKMSIENTIKLHTETEAGTGTWPPSFNAKMTTDTEFKHGYIHETTANFTQTSVQDTQSLASCWEEHSANFANGQISVAMKLVNKSGLSFKVKNIRVIAYQMTTGSNFRLIGALDPDNWNVGGYVLGPYGDITMTVKKSDIDAETMKALVENPSALMFEVGGYELFQLDDWDVNETVNYAKLGESVVQQTGLLTVDYGNGTIERHMVATNVYRNPDGSAAGITLKEVLTNILKMSYETEVQKDSEGTVIGMKVLKKLKTIATYQNDAAQQGRGFWVVGGNSDAFAEGIDVDFDNIVLNSNERISLVFLKDTDLDGLFDNEEQLLGSSPIIQDTDGDGITDYDEAKVGWDVTVAGATYHVYSDPRFADVDGDYLSDSAEKVMGTDPYKKDTDGDGIADTNDPYPLSAPCMNGNTLGLAAWWNGTMAMSQVSDMWHTAGTGDPLGYASNGVLTGNLLSTVWKPDYIAGVSNNVFGFNNSSPLQHDQQISIADDPALDPRRSLSPQAQFTLAGWVYWDGVMTGAEWGTIFAKGVPGSETYGIYVKSDGTLSLGLYREYHEKCWYLWFAKYWDDAACADDTHVAREALDTPTYRLPLQTWVHLTATFGNETMRIYADGTLVGEKFLNNIWGSSYYKYQNTTNYLISNTIPLRIGLERDAASAGWPYRGMMDELQVFGRQMQPSEVTQFHTIGVCGP